MGRHHIAMHPHLVLFLLVESAVLFLCLYQ